MPLICRTCGQQVHLLNSKNLFNKDGVEIVQNIRKLTGQQISRNMDMPENICIACLLQLNNAMAFREQCLKMFQKLNELPRTTKAEIKHEIISISGCSFEELDGDTSESDFVMFYKDGEKDVTMEIKQLNQHFSNSNQSVENDDDLEKDAEANKFFDSQYTINEDDDEASGSDQINPLASSFRTKKVSTKPTKTKRTRGNANGRFFCEKCFKCFSDKSNLNVHMKRHDEKKFECPECGRLEFTQHLVNLHVRIKHKGELPYACKFCGERFDNSLKRLRHERVLHLNYDYPRNHTCSICNKSFMDRATLKFHEVVHSGEQPFHCDLCKVSFNRKSSLSTHFRSKTHKTKEQDQAVLI